MNSEVLPLRHHSPEMGHSDWCDIVTYLTNPQANLPSGYGSDSRKVDKHFRIHYLGQQLAAELAELDPTSTIFRTLAGNHVSARALRDLVVDYEGKTYNLDTVPGAVIQ